MEFLYEYARMAVQTFLVFGGFSLAWMLGDRPLSWTQASQAFAWRYLRLVIPYAAAIALLLLAASLTTTPTGEPPLIDSFSWAQAAAHVFFLQDVLDYGNFSAGTWYLCIDLQFAFLFLALAAIAQSLSRRYLQTDATPNFLCLFLAPLGVCSAWLWNRAPGGDIYVFYFLAPMILGVFVAWFLRGNISLAVLLAYAGLVAASLALDFRPRLALALVAGGALLVLVPSAAVESVCRHAAPLGRISYSLFLIHYLINWLVLAAFAPLLHGEPVRAIIALVAAFVASLIAALALYYGVERPALSWLNSLRPAPETSARYRPAHA
jgi:peptidoglycan/LPS O-acetylase OafA/YrhL